MRVNSALVSERLDDEWLVLDPGTSEVHRLSGPSADVFSAVMDGTAVPAGCEHAVGALVAANILVADSSSSRRRFLIGTTTAAAVGLTTG